MTNSIGHAEAICNAVTSTGTILLHCILVGGIKLRPIRLVLVNHVRGQRGRGARVVALAGRVCIANLRLGVDLYVRMRDVDTTDTDL